MVMDVKPLKIEIEKRRANTEALVKAEEALLVAVDEYTELDNGFKGELGSSRTDLEDIYKELRHYSGNWPIVYTDIQIDKYPYYNGETDDKCNPYFRMTAVQAGDPGIEPIDAPTTRTTPAVYNRERVHDKEDIFRGAALTALNAYPDNTNETLTTTFECVGGLGGETTEGECTTNGGIWTEIDPVWAPEETAVGLLKAALNPWKSDIEVIIADVYSSTSTVDFWQDILDEINNCLGLLPIEPTYPNQTPAPIGALLTSIDSLKTYADTSTTTFVSSRKSDLETVSLSKEQLFFGIIKLRLHFVNGSYSKLKAASGQQSTNESLIRDNKEAIITLTNIIISQ